LAHISTTPAKIDQLASFPASTGREGSGEGTDLQIQAHDIHGLGDYAVALVLLLKNFEGSFQLLFTQLRIIVEEEALRFVEVYPKVEIVAFHKVLQ
jgi:hypothetical protein